VAIESSRLGLGDARSGPIRDALELSAPARGPGLGGALERIVLVERALQPTGDLPQNVDVRVAHAREMALRDLDVYRPRALRVGFSLVGHLCAFIERAITVAGNRAVVHE
jgi:hypothetical protein